jgi:hypothetical protein
MVKFGIEYECLITDERLAIGEIVNSVSWCVYGKSEAASFRGNKVRSYRSPGFFFGNLSWGKRDRRVGGPGLAFETWVSVRPPRCFRGEKSYRAARLAGR